jgi:DNA modification methylase
MIVHGDCAEAMAAMPESSVDSIVTDPPYHLSFMGREWDHAPTGAESQAMHETWAREALRVLKPGGHLLAFGGTRTYHRLACAVEDAGFEIRDSIMWLYGSGFPKSLDVSKAIDKAAGLLGDESVRFDYAGRNAGNVPDLPNPPARGYVPPPPASTESERWTGWGTALKPAHEPIVMARKPLIGTVAANALAHGTGALNVDGCRVWTADNLDGGAYAKNPTEATDGWRGGHRGSQDANSYRRGGAGAYGQPSGRWPANLVLSHADGCECVGERKVRTGIAGPRSRTAFTPDGYVGGTEGGAIPAESAGGYANKDGTETVEAWECVGDCPVAELDAQSGAARSAVTGAQYTDMGGASRFFYVAKASRAERHAGLAGFEAEFAPTMGNGIGGKEHDPATATPKRNHHPTVKPINLMRWLVRLVTPLGGTVLDPFAGSGTTGIAATLEGFEFIGVEQEAEYVAIAEARIAWWAEHPEGMELGERIKGEAKRAKIVESGQGGLF